MLPIATLVVADPVKVDTEGDVVLAAGCVNTSALEVEVGVATVSVSTEAVMVDMVDAAT